MNYKMLLPSYRERFRCLLSTLDAMRGRSWLDGAGTFLNLGCGEGDFDAYLLDYFIAGYGCDINCGDIRHCRAATAQLPLHYAVADAHRLPYAAASFDCVVSIDVVEHTRRPDIVIAESARVLKCGGYAIFSFPRQQFPVAYDPINAGLRRSGRHLPIGAYAYGHDKLIDEREFLSWSGAAGFAALSNRLLGRTLVGLLECYWPGLVQKALKPNAANSTLAPDQARGLRPSAGIPRLARLTDLVIAADRGLFGQSSASIGAMYLLRKEH